MPLAIRDQFPALNRPVDDAGTLPVFFDNPAGTQVPQRVIDAVTGYYLTMNANHGGAFATSQHSDAMVYQTREVVASFLNARRPEEIVFGPNMTTLNFGLSRALAKTLEPGDEIVVTRIDHDANIAPWSCIAEDGGFKIRWVDIDVEDCTLDMGSLERALSRRTRIVATAHASNAVGTINPVMRIADLAHDAGALFVLDAVQSAPHIPIDVQAIDCDFLLCSAYKFFGPHTGVLWGRYDLLAELPAYKVRPADNLPPYRWETGTLNFEMLAGTAAAITYISEVGMEHIVEYERALVMHLIADLAALPGVQIYGLTDPAQFARRVPTVAFRLKGYHPRVVAERLAAHHIYVWDGNYYALAIMERLGLEETGGAVRVGLAHYNTHAEIDRLMAALREL
ncbi:MAG: cysteine desulfurase-like protein [Anaerolineae bacterium]|nr:cysteine desulfurase-like protein [Anaerolineae bacterium]